jgi:hypothetical protein
MHDFHSQMAAAAAVAVYCSVGCSWKQLRLEHIIFICQHQVTAEGAQVLASNTIASDAFACTCELAGRQQ